jgi:riboflavin kinase/FMN adenylyltransferase
MKLFRHLEDLPDGFRQGAVSIGNFDGVHLGHARIVERLIDDARRLNGAAIVFTFDPHPVRLLRPHEAPPPLTWTERKADLLNALGVDTVVAYPTDETLLSLSPTEFFDRIIVQQLKARAMVEGPNFFFGRDRQGDIRTLERLCGEHGVDLEIVEPIEVDGEYISSSRVRKLIRNGDVQAASSLLTKPYRIRGMVTHGARRGEKLGFPTANLDAVDTLLPAHGVYAGRAVYEAGSLPAAINIGPNPTFGENAVKVEAHLIDFTGSLYGQPLEIDFLARLRDVERFQSVDRLQEQLRADVAMVRDLTN